MEKEINDDISKAYESIYKSEQKRLDNLKPNEAIFDGIVYDIQKKSDVTEVIAIVSVDPDTFAINILWCEEADEEEVEDYINSKYKYGNPKWEMPTGTFLLKYWTYSYRDSYEYDEWDVKYSLNFETEIYSNNNFERALKSIQKYKSALEGIRNKFNSFRFTIIPLHVGDKETFPHKLADVIQDFCLEIEDKISEVLNG